jgi:hypothetical protein
VDCVDAAFWRSRWLGMCDDEDRHPRRAGWTVCAPKRHSLVVVGASGDYCAVSTDGTLQVFAVHRIVLERPGVQPLAIQAQRLFSRLAGCGYETSSDMLMSKITLLMTVLLAYKKLPPQLAALLSSGQVICHSPASHSI